MKNKIGISYTRTNFANYWNWFAPNDLGNDLELVELNFEKNNTPLKGDRFNPGSCIENIPDCKPNQPCNLKIVRQFLSCGWILLIID